jgi:hypothetical protein
VERNSLGFGRKTGCFWYKTCVFTKGRNPMPGWKDITKLSESDEKKRAAAFEAQMLASLAKDLPAPAKPPPRVAPPTPPPAVRPCDGIQISVTANGQTTNYANLETVPVPVRQRILNTWFPAPDLVVPPVLPAPTNRPEPPAPAAHRSRSRRFAQGLNLFLPGSGQIYLGHRLTGSVYAFAFLGCFVTMILVFVRGYSGYLRLTTGGDILEGNNLEQLAHAFPTGLLFGLLIVATAIYFTSAIHLSRLRPSD